ncbi:unnamed protein product [Heterobilharzia americana]|nr:unnamed protein product [Heterobilharzia americana]
MKFLRKTCPRYSKFKVLIEFFNKEEQCFAIKHTQDQAMIKTYFIERRLDDRPVISLPPTPIEVESNVPQYAGVYDTGTVTTTNLPTSEIVNTVSYAIDSHSTTEQNHDIVTIPSNGDNKKLLDNNQLSQSVSAALIEHPLSGDNIGIAGTNTTSVATTSTITTTAGTASMIGRGSDVEMLQALQDFVQPDEVFIFPPISKLSLNFFIPIVEKSYRNLGLRPPRIYSVKKLSWSTPRVAPFINTITETILIIIISLTCLIIFPDSRLAVNTPIFYIILFIAFIIHSVLLLLLILDLAAWAWYPRKYNHHNSRVVSLKNYRNDWRYIVIRLYGKLFHWQSRNIIGIFILILPTSIILSSYSYCLFNNNDNNNLENNYTKLLSGIYRTQIGLLFTFMFINCTLYTSFSSWTKTISATFVCLLSLILICLHRIVKSTCTLKHIQVWLPSIEYNFNIYSSSHLDDQLIRINTTSLVLFNSNWINPSLSDNIIYEYIVIGLLTLILIGALNREFDINFRLSFHRDYEALQAKKAIGHQKLQADWLLENIIPYYIMNDLRQHNKYSQHIENAGVYLHVLQISLNFMMNNIKVDKKFKYKDVEKIKTIGACFMAASGLNIIQRKYNKQSDEHLWALLDFAIDLIHTLDDFNRQMFNFQFELKVGYNIGEVTAGVIGTTKLLYDMG